jgi:hypothetical protein
MGLIALLAVLLFVVLPSWLRAPSTLGPRNHPPDDYPDLFVESVACPHRRDVLSNGHRSEELARLRADRYEYDPQDGIRAVHRYLEAESCYRAEGYVRGAHSTHRLLNALERERWAAALSEIRRLLLLTDHIGRHEYVEWLRKNIGKVAAKASAES